MHRCKRKHALLTLLKTGFLVKREIRSRNLDFLVGLILAQGERLK
jgi:hypothetical protein